MSKANERDVALAAPMFAEEAMALPGDPAGQGAPGKPAP
jgi:hypothetical protein